MIFLGETFFQEKGFPEPFPKTFLKRENENIGKIFPFFSRKGNFSAGQNVL